MLSTLGGYPLGGKLKGGPDMDFLQFRIVLYDFMGSHTGGQPAKNIRDSYTSSFYAWFSKTYIAVDNNKGSSSTFITAKSKK
jgi:predicted GNAT superfamily acetyltransferase